MFRSLTLSVCFLFVAQGALANFGSRVEKCMSDLNKGSNALIQAAQTVDNQYKSEGYNGFNYFTKMIKDGNRAGTDHMNAAEAYMSNRGTTMQNYDNLNRIHSAVSAAMPQATGPMRACNSSSSCKGMKSKARHIKNLKIKCNQLIKVQASFDRFAQTKAVKALSASQSAVKAMKGTDRNQQMIAAARKAEGAKGQVIAENKAPAGNGEVTDNDTVEEPVFTEPLTPPAKDKNGAIARGLRENPVFAQPIKEPLEQPRKVIQAKPKKRGGSLEAVTRCQSKYRNNLGRFKFCGCRIHGSYRLRKRCTRGVARQSDSELCERNRTIKNRFRRLCRKASFSASFWN